MSGKIKTIKRDTCPHCGCKDSDEIQLGDCNMYEKNTMKATYSCLACHCSFDEIYDITLSHIEAEQTNIVKYKVKK